jgi:hypothetical protein
MSSELSDLCEKLDNYDDSLIDFYKSNEVAFANAPAVDLRSADVEEAVRKLAKRIYATRNALVHTQNRHLIA